MNEEFFFVVGDLFLLETDCPWLVYIVFNLCIILFVVQA